MVQKGTHRNCLSTTDYMGHFDDNSHFQKVNRRLSWLTMKEITKGEHHSNCLIILRE